MSAVDSGNDLRSWSDNAAASAASGTVAGEAASAGSALEMGAPHW
jgi:hypothetical protein